MESMIMIVAMLAMLLLYDPREQAEKEAQNMRDSLTVGDVITTIGGITGTICTVKENTIVIESGVDRVRIELTKWAVSSKTAQGGGSRALSRRPGNFLTS